MFSHLLQIGRRGAGPALMLTSILAATCPSSVAANGLIGNRAAHAIDVSPSSRDLVADVTAAHLDTSADKAKLTFDLSAGVQPTAFVLADPDRVIVDLPQVNFSVDPATTKAGEGRRRSVQTTKLVGSYRYGLLCPGRSRIVIDLGAPARIVSAAVQGGKLVIELAKTDRDSFRAAARKQRQAVVASSTASAAPAVQSVPAGRATIVLDAGHGGPDLGAVVNGVVEKDVTLGFAKLLASKLEANGRFNVVMTRATDVFLPLSERVREARAVNAALMISIHADTLPESPDVSGATVYTVSDKASDAYAAKVAAKENQADASDGMDGQAETADVNDILFDLTRQETRAYSHVFSRTLVNYWKVAGRLNKNPQRAAGFVVLKAPDVPSVLLELGYLSSPADTASLVSSEWREKAAGRMAEAIDAYFADQRGPAKAASGVPISLAQAKAVGTSEKH